MLRQTLVITVAASFMFAAIGGEPAFGAEKCRNDKGQFTKCPDKPATATKCRDKTTKKFAKCDAPNTEPVPSK